jgi:LysR family transcriptional regulator for metE and metH
MIEVRHFQLIKTIAESGSMTKAAQQMFLTQPSLSHQLREIEAKLERKLFLRVNKTMVLTKEGRTILEGANDILSRVRLIEKAVQGKKDKALQLRVTTQCHTCYHWLPAIMKKFQAELANVDIDVVPEAMSQPVDYLLNGEIDLAIMHSNEARKGIRFEKLFVDEQVVLVPAQHRLSTAKYLNPADFENEPLIIYKNDLANDNFARNVLIPSGVTPSKVIKMQLTEARVELVRAGLGLAVLSRWLAKPFLRDNASIKLLPIGKKGFYRTWYAATLDQKNSDPHVREFVAFLKEQRLGGG